MPIHAFVIDVLRLTLWLFILAAIFVPLERWLNVRPNKLLREGLAADIGFYYLSSLVPTLLIALPLASLAALMHRILPGWWLDSLAGLPLGVKLALVFVIGDLGFYWAHRFAHEWPLLWRFHAVHHAPEHMDWLVNTHAHPVDMIVTRLGGLAPVYLLGIAQPDIRGSLPAVIVVLVGTVWGFLIHANARIGLGPGEAVIASPRFHHWHHVRTGPINRNYAAMIPLLDRLFGTYYLPERQWPDAYGIENA